MHKNLQNGTVNVGGTSKSPCRLRQVWLLFLKKPRSGRSGFFKEPSQWNWRCTDQQSKAGEKLTKVVSSRCCISNFISKCVDSADLILREPSAEMDGGEEREGEKKSRRSEGQPMKSA